jgi:hypothetical protein
MSNPKTAKAERATIHLGDIPLEVFQLPDGTYRLSQTQAAEAIGKDEISFRDFLKSKSPEALPYKGFRSEKIGISDNNSKIAAIPIKLAAAYWVKESIAQNAVASRLLGACVAESIERRADAAFGIQRTEEEYNERFTVRVDLKDVKRKEFVRAIAHWQHKLGIYGSTSGNKNFKDAHDRINIGLQNHKSMEIKAANNLPKSALIRDFFAVEVLMNYSSVSQIATNFLKDGTASNPLEAVDMAFACFLPSNYIAKPCQLVEDINKVRQSLNKMKNRIA